MTDKITQEEILGEGPADWYDPPRCPECGSTDVETYDAEYEDGFLLHQAHIQCNNPECEVNQ